MLLKMVGFFLLPLSGYLLGNGKIHSLLQEKAILEQYCKMLQAVSQMAGWGYSCHEILQKLREQESFYSELRLWDCAELRKFTLPGALRADVRENLGEIFPYIGLLQVEPLQLEIQHYQSMAQNIIRNDDIIICKAKQLYSKIGFWCGLALAIFLV